MQCANRAFCDAQDKFVSTEVILSFIDMFHGQPADRIIHMHGGFCMMKARKSILILMVTNVGLPWTH